MELIVDNNCHATQNNIYWEVVLELDNLFYANWVQVVWISPLIITEWRHHDWPLGFPIEFLGDLMTSTFW